VLQSVKKCFVLPRVGLSFTDVVKKTLCLYYTFKYENNNRWREIAFLCILSTVSASF